MKSLYFKQIMCHVKTVRLIVEEVQVIRLFIEDGLSILYDLLEVISSSLERYEISGQVAAQHTESLLSKEIFHVLASQE